MTCTGISFVGLLRVLRTSDSDSDSQARSSLALVWEGDIPGRCVQAFSGSRRLPQVRERFSQAQTRGNSAAVAGACLNSEC
eukprot:356256-Chlamydomonas_euryale.AAC.4